MPDFFEGLSGKIEKAAQKAASPDAFKYGQIIGDDDNAVQKKVQRAHWLSDNRDTLTEGDYYFKPEGEEKYGFDYLVKNEEGSPIVQNGKTLFAVGPNKDRGGVMGYLEKKGVVSDELVDRVLDNPISNAFGFNLDMATGGLGTKAIGGEDFTKSSMEFVGDVFNADLETVQKVSSYAQAFGDTILAIGTGGAAAPLIAAKQGAQTLYSDLQGYDVDWGKALPGIALTGLSGALTPAAMTGLSMGLDIAQGDYTSAGFDLLSYGATRGTKGLQKAATRAGIRALEGEFTGKDVSLGYASDLASAFGSGIAPVSRYSREQMKTQTGLK